jgi:Ala-tRNA(Pro) deacylase
MNNKEVVYSYLEDKKVEFTRSCHAPIYTIEELVQMDIENKDKIPKNLFLRNDSGNQHYIITIAQHKEVDLKDLRKQIGSSRLGFASEDRLMKYLKLKKGAVSPLGILNDTSMKVKVYLDEDLRDSQVIGVHPNENDETVWLSFKAIKQVVELHGNPFGLVKIEE